MISSYRSRKWAEQPHLEGKPGGHDPSAGELAVDSLRMVNAWDPLVPARPENGCMQFIPETHKLPIEQHFCNPKARIPECLVPQHPRPSAPPGSESPHVANHSPIL